MRLTGGIWGKGRAEERGGAHDKNEAKAKVRKGGTGDDSDFPPKKLKDQIRSKLSIRRFVHNDGRPEGPAER